MLVSAVCRQVSSHPKISGISAIKGTNRAIKRELKSFHSAVVVSQEYSPLLFLTNRKIDQDSGHMEPFPGLRNVKFNLANPVATSSLFFCQTQQDGGGDGVALDKGDEAVEIGSQAFFNQLKEDQRSDVLVYIHGYNTFPADAFQNTRVLQRFFDDSNLQTSVRVIPFVWPSEGQLVEYYTDQRRADMTGFTLGRALDKFSDWRRNQQGDHPCFKPIHVLAHSMGNRVFSRALESFSGERQMPRIFKNVFLFAADIVNEGLEPGQIGGNIARSARRVSVYHADDDLPLGGSKVANIAKWSRRLGQQGPEDMSKIPGNNVFSIDCDSINGLYDRLLGHTYFKEDQAGNPGKAFLDMATVIRDGVQTSKKL